MIKYMPDNHYFNWDIPANVPTEHWQQVLTNTPYEEIVKFMTNNPAIKHTIEQRLNHANNGNN